MQLNSSIETWPQLNRIKIVQAILDRKSSPTYLEIGVNTGACFLKIKAKQKIGVDPQFKIPLGRKLKYKFRNRTNFNCLYFQETSDLFFLNQHRMLMDHPPSVILIDGLHTYQQSLSDVKNALQILAPGGVIVMHDCNPLSEAAGFPAPSIEHVRALHLDGWDNVWNGDVWKTIVHLRTFHDNLDVRVLDCDHGIGIIRKCDKRQTTLQLTGLQISKMSYQDLENNRAKLLNLRAADAFWGLLHEM